MSSVKTQRSLAARTPLPLGWYVFFGVIEPISVLAGCVYAIGFQQNYYGELVPTGYLKHAASAVASAAATRGKNASGWSSFGSSAANTAAAAAAAASSLQPLNAPTKMALAQLGSCYFLIMLNSALMFYAIRRWFGQSPVAQERVLYALFTVLGLADWTHILLTIYFLPPTLSSSSISEPLASSLTSGCIDFARKVWLLLTHTDAWNSLLFGNIVITFLLFCARAAWWVGLGRDRFFDGNVPEVPAKKSS